MKEMEDVNDCYKQEVESRWGNSDEYRESSRRTEGYDATEWKKIRGEDDAIISTFASLIGYSLDDSKVKETVKRWQFHISHYYYECTDEILLSLGDMYVSDGRFTATVDRYKEGTALFMNQAIHAYVKNV